jgi:hypothetical protein
MKNRRAFLLSVTSGFVALAVLAAPVIADELIGFISKVDVGAKKLTVTTDDGEKEVTVTDDTVIAKKGEFIKLDLEKFAAGVEKAKEKNGKGYRAKITHEGGKVSKIESAKKKAN